jgi:hypothetical protein
MIGRRVPRLWKRDGPGHHAIGLESWIDRVCRQQVAAQQRHRHDQDERQGHHGGDEPAAQPSLAWRRGCAAAQDVNDVAP